LVAPAILSPVFIDRWSVSRTTFRDSFAAWVPDYVDSMVFMESSMWARVRT
jgi:hypothetical protein